jgi:hypothetical protein
MVTYAAWVTGAVISAAIARKLLMLMVFPGNVEDDLKNHAIYMPFVFFIVNQWLTTRQNLNQ